MNEIETILTKLLHCDRQGLYLDKHQQALNVRQLNRLEHILQKRVSGFPLQYLVGDVEFMGLRLRVKPGVLIPRPETEILVEEAAREIVLSAKKLCRILDIGTGSGNIAIALAASKDLGELAIDAVDISFVCLAAARANARLHHLQHKIAFHHSDIFSCFEGKDDRFDFIISNPPYISDQEYTHLPPDVQQEPASALLAAEAGFYFYRKIEEGARQYLAEHGMIFLEIGATQGLGIKKIFSDSNTWQEVKLIRDYNGFDRVVLIRLRKRPRALPVEKCERHA